MLLNASFIAACLLLINVSQAAPVGDIANQNGFQTSNLQFQRRQTPSLSTSPLQLTDEQKKTIEKSKLETKAKLDAATSAGATIDPNEISEAVKKATASNTNSDSKTTGKAIKGAIESLADKKLAEAKGKSPAPQRRQASAGSLQLTEEEKIAVDKSKVETKAKIDAAIAAGATVDQSEILAAIKKAISDTPNGDRKATGKAIKVAVENLIDQKLAEAKGKPSSRRRSPELSEEAKAALEHVKKEGKARIEAVTSAGGTVEDSEILAVIKKADAETPGKDINTAKAIKAGFISLTDQKLAEAEGKPSSRQRRSPELSEEAKASLEHVKKEGKARIEAVTSAGGTVEDSEILAVIKKADVENPSKDINTAKAIKAGFISLTEQKLAEAKSKSSPQ